MITRKEVEKIFQKDPDYWKVTFCFGCKKQFTHKSKVYKLGEVRVDTVTIFYDEEVFEEVASNGKPTRKRIFFCGQCWKEIGGEDFMFEP